MTPVQRSRLILTVLMLGVLGGLAPFAAQFSPAIGGMRLAVDVALAQVVGFVLGIWTVFLWQGKI